MRDKGLRAMRDLSLILPRFILSPYTALDRLRCLFRFTWREEPATIPAELMKAPLDRFDIDAIFAECHRRHFFL